VTADGREVTNLKKTMESYMKSSTCIVCRATLDNDIPICRNCIRQAPHSLLLLRSRLLKAQRNMHGLVKICRSCSALGSGEEVKCDSKDCPVFYTRTRTRAALANEEAVLNPVVKLLEEHEMKGIDW
jgi:DNA polymerase zeta